jgi:hypothetical protein
MNYTDERTNNDLFDRRPSRPFAGSNNMSELMETTPGELEKAAKRAPASRKSVAAVR